MGATPSHIVIEYATRVTTRRWPRQLWICLIAAIASPVLSTVLSFTTNLDYNPHDHDHTLYDALMLSLAVLLYLGPPTLGTVYGISGLIRVCAHPTRWKGLAIGLAITGIMMSLVDFLYAEVISTCL